ncbi:insulinase family protein [Trichloromonas acetexigens]|uniref:Peptidase M16 n=1 Tax=Trichloromonas acetexigens TaxID=38815 RepID=A0A550J8C2_9BACT|nr:insulinase family protein [Desulfuromonas acetexigens]TRO79490.1 peptidase M16 [Desulfuromonas acetexigens]
MTDTRWTAGFRKHGFTVTGATDLPEINLSFIELRHDQSGARMVHLAANDPNCLFAVGFRTPPDDSTGVAHILEHTVLCGSRRFPVRDPFFAMLKRSLNTFMNAMTASDWTLYPFASQNRKDFFNLLSIYLDAAFFPLLSERDFRQEGHRLEFADPDDPNAPLEYKGVVYNEMKGAMSDPSSLLGRRLAAALYPTTTYRHNSGGEPAKIPDLSWEQLRKFHADYYHPANAYFFTYGDLDLKSVLAVIDQEALSAFERRPATGEVPPEIHLTSPRRVEEAFPVDPGTPLEKRALVQVAWLTCDINDKLDRLGLSLLASLLLGNSAAPLYRALLDSGLGSNLAPGGGYQDDNRTTYFAAGLQGIDPEKSGEVEALILATLEESARTDFSAERIDGILHRLEFSIREVTGDQYPYPLVLLMRLIGPWIHGGNPVEALRFDELLGQLRRKLAEGPYFQDLIRRYLLDNPHRVTLTLRPDDSLQARQDQAITAHLEELRGQLDAHRIEEIRYQARELREAQEAEEDLSCLPTLELSDIPPTEPAVDYRKTQLDECPVYWFDQPTNGIGYITLHFHIGGLSEEHLALVPVFCTLLGQIGAAGYSYTEMAERMEAATGGIHARATILDAPESLAASRDLLALKGKALIRNQEKLFAILGDLCRAPDFTDHKRLHTVLNQIRTSLENSIPGSGHSYAARSAAGGLTPAARLREAWSGLEQLQLIKSLAAKSPEELSGFAESMAAMAAQLLSRRRLSCAITGEQGHFAEISPALEQFLTQLPVGEIPAAQVPQDFAPQVRNLGWSTSVPVNYVSRVFRAVPYTHPDSAALMVLAKLLRAGYLHREIREKGGAYGGLANYGAEGGIFSFLSYRDPHLTRTLQVYDDAVDWAVAGRFDDEQIKEGILSIFADLDRPLSPGGRGSQEFANIEQGLTLEMRNALRRRILAIDRETLCQTAARYLSREKRLSAVGVIAGETALRQANQELGEDFLHIETI